MSKNIRTMATILTFSLVAMLASPAAAQDVTPNGGGLVGSSSSTLTWLVPTTTTAGIVLLIIYLVKPSDGAAMLQQYLDENGREVAMDMATGEGVTVGELSQMFGVFPEHRQDFARVLRANNHKLQGALTHEHVTIEQAAMFMEVVTAAMLAD
ncbi:unnamed protein product, partial [Laminaria digitata]